MLQVQRFEGKAIGNQLVALRLDEREDMIDSILVMQPICPAEFERSTEGLFG